MLLRLLDIELQQFKKLILAQLLKILPVYCPPLVPALSHQTPFHILTFYTIF
jgi:hypothetical protein